MNPISYAGTIPENPDEVVVYFVYGTLCRGQCRQHCWPITPLAVHPAWVQGTLFGREDYPALRPGNQRVGGECWFFSKPDAQRVTAVLDEIEVTNQPGHPNLYDRVELQANLVAPSHQKPVNQVGLPQTWVASAYHYATDPLRDGFDRLTERETEYGTLVLWPPEKWRLPRDL
ncbi:gamma-glutamylcyclotransferase family protein [Rhodopirellula sp. P2]|uniref:gamma-glutamylcyclotransferase family protein n=1 Tax=Rhodopirellula sp. P2 TaxID=2127060 RepID=UPI002368BCD3|nr:gamma-glutamylcyclotransferase family protein [Rhodopirellula sp. P2]WDQ16821.1 gamma-glutamylcyclotransferase [Rhodopirellula sp. P2]